MFYKYNHIEKYIILILLDLMKILIINNIRNQYEDYFPLYLNYIKVIDYIIFRKPFYVLLFNYMLHSIFYLKNLLLN